MAADSGILELGSCPMLCSEGEPTSTALKNTIIKELQEHTNELQTPNPCLPLSLFGSLFPLFLSLSFNLGMEARGQADSTLDKEAGKQCCVAGFATVSVRLWLSYHAS